MRDGCRSAHRTNLGAKTVESETKFRNVNVADNDEHHATYQYDGQEY